MRASRCVLVTCCLLVSSHQCFCWGFYSHRKINYFAVFLLPPEMMVLYKPALGFLSEHAVDPDKRRYIVPAEGPKHYIDIDRYDRFPFLNVTRNWDSAINRYSRDTVLSNGIVPWWIPIMLQRLTVAFKEKDAPRILKLSAEIGHYIADAHVPLHASHNHNGQYTDQKGVHGFWESRVPELLADKEFDFFIGRASYLKDPSRFIWERVLESARAADTVLRVEKQLSQSFASDRRFAFESRNAVVSRQYSSAYTIAYNNRLNNMVERRMRQSIYATASFWYTAWVNAGQPDLALLHGVEIPANESPAIDTLSLNWRIDRSRICE